MNESAPRQAELAVLFADVAGSTLIYEQLGDERGREVVRSCLSLLARTAGQDGGRVVETVGDEIFAVYPSADCALASAVAMQEAVCGDLIAGKRLAIHIGVHFGPMLIGEDAVPFGDPVNVAHRIADLAKPGQVLLTAAALQAAGRDWAQTCRTVEVTVRGRREPVQLLDLLWKAEEATLLRREPGCGGPNGARLMIAAASTHVELNASNPALTIGRGEGNDLVIPESIVSRLHVRAECRGGRFILTDQSANGTYVVPDGGAAIFVHNQDHVLAGSGTLGLGEMPDAHAATTLRYHTVTPTGEAP